MIRPVSKDNMSSFKREDQAACFLWTKHTFQNNYLNKVHLEACLVCPHCEYNIENNYLVSCQASVGVLHSSPHWCSSSVTRQYQTLNRAFKHWPYTDVTTWYLGARTRRQLRPSTLSCCHKLKQAKIASQVVFQTVAI